MKKQIDLEPLHVIIRRFEGFRSKPYLCPAGVWTIGYGSTRGITKDHPPVTEKQAEVMMRLDALGSYQQALELSPVLSNHPMIACAIADFIYNLGAGRYRASTLRRKVAERNWPEVCEQLARWVWGGGKKLPGLVARRAVEVRLVQSDH